MIAFPSTQPAEGPPATPSLPSNPAAWWYAQALALALLVGLDGLMAILIWLPFYCGLFGYLVAGLIAGGVSFRLARRARPLSRKQVLAGVLRISVLSLIASVCWEYGYISSTIGDPPKFAGLMNKAVRAGESPDRVARAAAREFRTRLASKYAPGGPLGYARWAVASGEMRIELDGTVETVSIGHRGFAWPARTAIGFLLTALGLWLGLESLRSRQAVSNVLAPGETYDEIE